VKQPIFPELVIQPTNYRWGNWNWKLHVVELESWPGNPMPARIKDGFSFAWVLVTGSCAHSEVLNSFACALILHVFTVSSVGGEAISGSLDNSFSVSSGQGTGWIAVFICAVLHLVPIIMARYTAPKVDGCYSSKGVSSLEVSFEEVTSTTFEHEMLNIVLTPRHILF
jgi:hypothetical protein